MAITLYRAFKVSTVQIHYSNTDWDEETVDTEVGLFTCSVEARKAAGPDGKVKPVVAYESVQEREDIKNSLTPAQKAALGIL
jgi:hypothetical protein